MDRTNSNGSSKNSSILSASWNVVDSQDLNHSSEGSDAESIEVIDEDTHNAKFGINEGSDSTVQTSVAASSDLSSVHFVHDNDVIPDFSPDITKCSIQSSQDSSSSSSCTLVTDARRYNYLSYCGVFIVLVSFLLSGLTCSFIVYKAGEFATATLDYFYPKETRLNNKWVQDYKDLLDELQMYKKESQDLKVLLVGLNADVANLKRELALETVGNGFPPREPTQSEEDRLFEQLLSIHTDHLDSNATDNNGDEIENSFKSIEDMLGSLTVGKEREENLETIRIFYLIPKHLSVLSNFESSDENIKTFIGEWNEQLSVINQKLIEEMKEMQLKMIKHIVLRLRKTEKGFYKKLCDLKNIKRPECYDRFLKPFEKSDISLENGKDVSMKCVGCNSNKPPLKTIVGSGNLNQGSNGIDNNINSKYDTANSRGVPLKPLSIVKREFINNRKPHEQPKKQFSSNKPLQKGMNSDLHQDVENKLEINSFSSFSEGSGEKDGVPWQRRLSCGREKGEGNTVDERRGRRTCWKSELEEGSWLLRLGRHRSHIRYLESRGDWVFDRARYRRWGIHPHRSLPQRPLNREKFSQILGNFIL